MAETPLKRQRDETQLEDGEETKRHKSYNHIISLLEVEEDEPAEDLSSLMTSLQHELSTDDIFDSIPCQTIETDQENNPTTASTTTAEDCAITSSSPSSASSCSKEDEANDRERVMRHLLEASDDELGIPSMEVRVNSTEYGDVGVNSGDELALCDGLWDLEDEAANYYTLLQSELFM